MTAEKMAAEILRQEVYYWGQKGLETTQRCSIKATDIRAELIRQNAPVELLDFWLEVNKEIYKQGQ